MKYTPLKTWPTISRESSDILRLFGPESIPFQRFAQTLLKTDAFILGCDLEYNEPERYVEVPTILGVSDGALTISVPFHDGLPYFKDLLARFPNMRFLGHAFTSADFFAFRQVGLTLKLENIEDTIIRHALVNAHLCKGVKSGEDDEGPSKGKGYMNLWTFLSLYTSLRNYKACIGEENGCDGSRPCRIHSEYEYNGTDSVGPVWGFPHILKSSIIRGVEKLYPLHRELAYVLGEMARYGVQADKEYLYGEGGLQREFERQKAHIEGVLPFNPKSNKAALEHFKKKEIVLDDWQETTIREACDEYDDAELHLCLDHKDLGAGVARWFAPVTKNKSGNWKGYMDAYGKIHPRLGMFTSTGRLQCYSKDTEILTKRGWTKFPDLQADDAVAQFDPATEQIDFVIPSRTIRQKEEFLLHIWTNDHIDLLVTEDHICLLRNRQMKSWEKVLARAFKEDAMHYSAGRYVGGSEQWSNSQLIVIAALQADGSICKKYGNMHFKFRKPRKTARLKKALTDSGIRFNFQPPGRTATFYIPRRNIPNWLQGKKFFGNWILEMSKDALQFFSREIFFWDGCAGVGNYYSSNEKSNADWAQVAQVLCGRRAGIRQHSQNKRNWIVGKSERPYSMSTNFEVRKVAYNDFVYCVTVPTGFVVVRRNNRVSVSGNCVSPNLQNVSARRMDRHNCECGERVEKHPTLTCAAFRGVSVGKLVRRGIIASPGHYLLESDFSNAENRCFLHQSGHRIPLEVDGHTQTGEMMRLTPDMEFVKLTGGGKVRQAAKSATHGCITGEHEVLTPQGWKRIDSCDASAIVAQWDVDGSKISFVPVQKFHEYDFSGDLVRLDTRGLQTLATPNHAWPVNINGSWNGIRYSKTQRKAFDQFTKAGRIAVNGNLIGEDFDISDDDIRRCVAVQADAQANKNRKGEWGGTVTFHIVKERKKTRVRALFGVGGVPCGCHPTGTRFSVNTSKGFKYPLLSGQKSFNEKVLLLSQRQREIFLAEILLWDGCVGKRVVNYSYINTDYASLVWVQTLAHLSGRQSLMRETTKYGSGFNSTKRRWSLSFNRRRFASVETMKVTDEAFSGKVYCFTVPSGYFLTRYRDTIHVTGNSFYLEGIQLKLPREITGKVKKEIDIGAREIWPEWKFNGKIVTFTGSNLAQRAFGDKTYENRIKALDVLKRLFGAYPGAREFQRKIGEMIERQGAYVSPYGYYLTMLGEDEERMKTAAAMAGSNPIAHLTKLALVEGWRALQKGRPMRPVLQVHDSILWEVRNAVVPEQAAEWANVLMSRETVEMPGMVIPTEHKVSIPLSGPSNWRDMVKI